MVDLPSHCWQNDSGMTIQIGRGEHRIFEVGWTNTGSKRISVDGEKPEITVNLVPESKP